MTDAWIAGRHPTRYRRRLIGGLLACTFISSLPVHAQTVTGPEQPDHRAIPADDQGFVATHASSDNAPDQIPADIVVSATRITRPGFQAPTPTTSFGADEIKKSGATNIADELIKIPSNRGTTTPGTTTLSSQNAGGNFVDLRGLGSQRTLVLVDGHRHVPTTSSGTVDLNVIPTGLIERVDVVTGGASAAWGSDAVAGVVNVILNDKLEGVRMTAQNGISQHRDNQDHLLSVAAGSGFAGGRGHVIFGAEYDKNDGVPDASNRGWYRDGHLAIANPSYSSTNGQAQMIAATHVTASNGTEGGLINSGPLRGIEFLPNGATRQFNYGTNVGASFQTDGDGVYPPGLAALTTPLERYNAFLRATYDVTPGIKAWVEGSYAHSRTAYELSFFNAADASITIRNDNAYLPASVRAQMAAKGVTSFTMGRFSDDIPYNQVDDRNDVYRVAGGLDGDLGGSWKWSVYGQYGETDYHATIDNNRITANFNRAVDAVVNPATGQVVCRSSLTASENGCVPIDLFGLGSPSAAAINYITGTQDLLSHIRETVAGGSIQGEPFSTWAGPVSVVAGGEYRRESVNQTVDAGSAAGIFNIGNPKALSGAYNVKEGFAETVVPLAKDMVLLQSLELNAAVRYTDYSTSGGVTTWKVGGSWQPVDGIRFRATRSRDIRAPSVSELFSSSVLMFQSVTDPVTGQQTSVAAPTTGNASLTPERANTTTAGIVLEPHFASGLRFSADFYNIDLKNVIGTLSAQNIVTFCAQGATNLCQFITRDPATNAITRVVRSTINLASTKVRGIDFELDYSLPLSQISDKIPGRLSTRLIASYLNRYLVDDGTRIRNMVTVIGAGGPRWRGLGSVTYDVGKVSLYGEVRYVGKGIIDPTITYSNNHVKDWATTTISTTWTVAESGSKQFQAFGSIQNLFNVNPRYVPTAYFPTNAGVYDVIGRYFSIGARVKF